MSAADAARRSATIAPSRIAPWCTGRRVGDDCLIGIGAVVMDGAKLGRRCVVGAMALVPPGMEVPEGSVVIGVPGKVTASRDNFMATRRNALIYHRNALAYAEGRHDALARRRFCAVAGRCAAAAAGGRGGGDLSPGPRGQRPAERKNRSADSIGTNMRCSGYGRSWNPCRW